MYFSCFSFLPCWLAESSWCPPLAGCHVMELRGGRICLSQVRNMSGVFCGDPVPTTQLISGRACGKWETFVPMLSTAHLVPTGCLGKTVIDRQSTCSLGSQIPWEPQFTNTQGLLISTRRRISKHPAAGSPLPLRYGEEQSQGSQSVRCGGERSLTLEISVVPRALGSL